MVVLCVVGASFFARFQRRLIFVGGPLFAGSGLFTAPGAPPVALRSLFHHKFVSEAMQICGEKGRLLPEHRRVALRRLFHRKFVQRAMQICGEKGRWSVTR